MSINTYAHQRPPRLLIAEDHDEFRKLLAHSFRQDGYDVTECRDGVELLSRLGWLDDPAQRGDFDLVISDVRMPGVTGLSVLEGLKGSPHVPPIILITAFGNEHTHAEALRLGAAAMIDKPFEIPELMSKAAEILRL